MPSLALVYASLRGEPNKNRANKIRGQRGYREHLGAVLTCLALLRKKKGPRFWVGAELIMDAGGWVRIRAEERGGCGVRSSSCGCELSRSRAPIASRRAADVFD